MLSLIVAFDKNRLIGNDNKLPWHISEDLKYFKATTINHKIVMGYNTFLSILDEIGHPFVSRHNIIVSENDFDHDYDNVEIVNDLETIVNKYKSIGEEVFISGGKSIYTQMIDHCDKLYITHIDDEFEGNVYFPKVDYDKFNLVSSNNFNNLYFNVYERKKDA